MKKIISKIAQGAGLLLMAAALFSFAACSDGSDSNSGSGSGSNTGADEDSDGYLTVDGDNVYLQKLNCLSDYTYSSGAFTNYGDQTTAASQLGGSWLIWGRPVSKSDSISMTAWITFNDVSKANGIGFLAQNGSYCIAYSAGMCNGVKNVNVDNCSDFSTDKGNGYSYYDGCSSNTEFLAKYKGVEIMEKVALDNESMVVTFYTTAGDKIADKSVTWASHWSADAKLYLGIGGFMTSGISVSKIKITDSGSSYNVNKVTELAVSSLVVDSLSTRVSVGGTSKITASATGNSGKAASVTVSSADESVATASASTSDGVTTITITGVASGTTTLTLTNASDSTLVKTVTVYSDAYAASDSYDLGSDSTYVYPAPSASDAPVDGWFRITFDSAPTIADGGCINVYKASDNTVIDTIQFSGETLNAWDGFDADVDKQMAYVSGNSLYFMMHYNKLEYETEYYICMPMSSVTGNLHGKDFSASGFTPTSKSWSFKTRATPVADGTKIYSVNCAEGSTANFRTIQGALLNIGTSATGQYTLNVAAGDYKEMVYYKGKADFKIIGAVASGTYGSDVVIHWFNGEKMNSGTHYRGAFYWGSGTDLVLENVTIKNDYDRAVYNGDAQAEAIYFANGGDATSGLAKAAFAAYNCSFLSHQDTIQTTGKNWFYKCYIEGDVDFLWGTAEAALFEDCELVSVLDSARGSSSQQHLIVARTGVTNGAQIGKGYVVKGGSLKIAEGVTCYLGRCAGAGNFYDQAAVVDTVIKGSGTLPETLWPSGTYTYLSGAAEHVGWKVYGLKKEDGSAVDTSKKLANTNVISDAVYTAEYSDRSQILDKVYVTATKAYAEDTTAAWDTISAYSMSSLKEEFSAE